LKDDGLKVCSFVHQNTTLVVWERELMDAGALTTKLVEFHEAAHA
jgi:hypothetical protein